MSFARFFVTDYDDTAFSYASKRADSLSQPIIDMAVKGNYAGFYGCTHRCYSIIDLTKMWAMCAQKWGTQLGHDASALDKNFPTYRITKNFADASMLPNMAVSTLDDILDKNTKAGYGFTAILGPYEIENKSPENKKQYIHKRDVLLNSRSKNIQLTQIAKHALATSGKNAVILDYVEDSAAICNNALHAMDDPEWPADATLNVYHYHDGIIELLKETDVFLDCEEPVTHQPSTYTCR